MSLDQLLYELTVHYYHHHYERCRLILQSRFNIDGIACPEQYAGYDPFEAQPRVMSPNEYIVNDFASMAGMAP